MAADYGGIVSGVISVLKADAVLTDPTTGLLAAYDPNGASPSRANSIFYGGSPPVAQPPTPCIALIDVTTGPAESTQHEAPMAAVLMVLVVYVFGQSSKLRPIEYELDKLLETAFRDSAMDTADWQFNDIDTKGAWSTAQTSEQLTDSNGIQIEQRFKTFLVDAASKNTQP